MSSVSQPSVKESRKPESHLHRSPPYQIKYQQKAEPLKGSSSISHKQMIAAIGSASIHLDTTKAGQYTYSFNEFSGGVTMTSTSAIPSLYTFSNKSIPFRPQDSQILARHMVIARMETVETQNIPITLEGVPPFTVEIGVSHYHGGSRPEIIRQKDIPSNLGLVDLLTFGTGSLLALTS